MHRTREHKRGFGEVEVRGVPVEAPRLQTSVSSWVDTSGGEIVRGSSTSPSLRAPRHPLLCPLCIIHNVHVVFSVTPPSTTKTQTSRPLGPMPARYVAVVGTPRQIVLAEAGGQAAEDALRTGRSGCALGGALADGGRLRLEA